MLRVQWWREMLSSFPFTCISFIPLFHLFLCFLKSSLLFLFLVSPQPIAPELFIQMKLRKTFFSIVFFADIKMGIVRSAKSSRPITMSISTLTERERERARSPPLPSLSPSRRHTLCSRFQIFTSPRPHLSLASIAQ